MLAAILTSSKLHFCSRFGGGSNGLEHVPGGVMPAGAVPATHLVAEFVDVSEVSVSVSLSAEAGYAVIASSVPASINAVITASNRFT